MKKYWFGVHCRSDWQPGASWELVHDDGFVSDAGEIVEIEPLRRIVIRWQHRRHADIAAQGDTLCAMTIEPVESAVKLSVLHTSEANPSALIAGVTEGWPKIFSNLKSFIETGSPIIGNLH